MSLAGELPRQSSSFLYRSPIQSPKIFATDKLDPDAGLPVSRRALPDDSSQGLLPCIGTQDMDVLPGLGGMFAADQRTVAADEHSFRILFPCPAKFFGTEPNGDCRHLARTPPQMAPEFAGRQDDIEKLGTVLIFKALSRVFDLVRVPCAFVDKTAHRFGI